MSERGEDRRSQRTRLALINALIELLGSRHYDQITIQDIVDTANVGRSTFYAHFEDKDHLLNAGFESMLDRLVEQIALDAETGEPKFDVTLLFQHSRGHFNLYRALMWGSGFDVLTQRGYDALSQKIEQRLAGLMAGFEPVTVPLPILAHSIAGSLLIQLRWWLDHKMPYPPEQMNDFFQKLVMSGVRVGVRPAGQPPAGRPGE